MADARLPTPLIPPADQAPQVPQVSEAPQPPVQPVQLPVPLDQPIHAQPIQHIPQLN